MQNCIVINLLVSFRDLTDAVFTLFSPIREYEPVITRSSPRYNVELTPVLTSVTEHGAK